MGNKEVQSRKFYYMVSHLPHLISRLSYPTTHLLPPASKYGEVSERFKELVSKTSDSEKGRGFESRLLRHFKDPGVA